jgi:hypothetical protein
LVFLQTDDIRAHMQDHPQELVFICRRKNPQQGADPHSEESVIILRLPTRADVQVVPYNDIDEITLQNLDNVHKTTE